MSEYGMSQAISRHMKEDAEAGDLKLDLDEWLKEGFDRLAQRDGVTVTRYPEWEWYDLLDPKNAHIREMMAYEDPETGERHLPDYWLVRGLGEAE